MTVDVEKQNDQGELMQPEQKEVAKLCSLKYFGESALLIDETDAFRNATVLVSSEKCDLLHLAKASFIKLIETNKNNKSSVTQCLLNREVFVNHMCDAATPTAASTTVMTLSQCIPLKRALKLTQKQSLQSTHLSIVVQLFLMIHAPISAKSFHYFDCHTLGSKKSMLRRDYSLECDGERYNEYLPAALTLLLGFALLLPILLSRFLYFHRNDLYSPKTKRKIGWLYSRFKKGAEFWEVHEVVRKMLLTGLLIYLPTNVRSPSAIVVCTLCCCTLNYYRPHRNPVVFWIDEICALLTTGKYLVTVFGNSMGDDVSDKDRQYLGYLLIGMDLIVIIGGQVCILALFFLVKYRITDFQQEGKQKLLKPTTVVPLNNKNKKIGKSRSKLLEPTTVVPWVPLNKRTVDRSRSRYRTEVKHSNSSLSLKTIQKAVLHDKVQVLEKVSEEHRQKNIKAILERKKVAETRVRKRLMVRRKSKKIKQEELNEVELAEVEKIRLAILRKVKTAARLNKMFSKLDMDHNGMLSKSEFVQLINAALKKKVTEKVLDLVWNAVWIQRKHGENDEMDASTMSHWLDLEAAEI